MSFTLTAFQEWYWAGGPGRRALAGLLFTVVFSSIWFTFDRNGARLLLILGLGWDVGGYGMDKAYVRRLSRQ
jgi:hypothetical protein